MRTVKTVLTGGDGDAVETNQDDNDHLVTERTLTTRPQVWVWISKLGRQLNIEHSYLEKLI